MQSAAAHDHGATAVTNKSEGFQVSLKAGGPAPRRVMEEILALGLERNILELELLGYTILTPEQTRAGDLPARLRAAILRAAEGVTGVPARLDDDAGYEAMEAPLGKGVMLRNAILTDRCFRESLVNRAVLAIADYLVGEDCILNQGVAMVKGRGGGNLALHCDTYGMPAPLSAHAHFANVTWILTDYTIENGCTWVVEGSHRLCRQPTPYEVDDTTIVTPIIAPAGSVIIWHGNTWHGAAPRTAPGLRLFWSNLYSRWYFEPQDPCSSEVTPEMAAEHPRLAKLMGLARLVRPKQRMVDMRAHNVFAADQFMSVPW